MYGTYVPEGHIPCFRSTVLQRIETHSLRQSAGVSEIAIMTREHSVLLSDIAGLIQTLPRSLGYTWEGSDRRPVWFVDSLGQKIPLPIELCLTRKASRDLKQGRISLNKFVLDLP